MRLRSTPLAVGGALVLMLLAGCSAPASSPGDVHDADLVGDWRPVAFEGETTPHLEFSRDGGVEVSDGCNVSSGLWDVGPRGDLVTTVDGQSEIGCDGVPVIVWLMDTAAVDLEGDELVLLDDAGAELGRLTRG